MRRRWAAGAAIVMCLALSGLPAVAQSPTETPTVSPGATMLTPDGGGLVHVTGVTGGAVNGAGGGFYHRMFVVKASDDRLTGCYSIAAESPDLSAGSWGTLAIVTDETACEYPRDFFRSAVDYWEGEWYSAQPWWMNYDLDTVWLHGHGDHEGMTAALRIDNDHTPRTDLVEGWIFPTPTLRSGD